MTLVISFELASLASLTVLALVLTPLLMRAKSGATVTLPSPTTTTRARAGDLSSAVCAWAPATENVAAIKTPTGKILHRILWTANLNAAMLKFLLSLTSNSLADTINLRD
jgi:hypothetical protein